MPKPWILAGTFELPNTNVFHRTAEGAKRSVLALENFDVWRVAQDGDAITLTPFSLLRLLPRGLAFFFNRRQWHSYPSGFRRATVRVADLAGGIAITYELELGGDVAASLILLALAVALLLVVPSIVLLVIVLVVATLQTLHVLLLPASFRSYIRRTIDRPAGPSDSIFDSLLP